MFKDTEEGTTHSFNDGCGESEHNCPMCEQYLPKKQEKCLECLSDEEDMHFSCDTRLKKEGKDAKCCFCDLHEWCEFFISDFKSTMHCLSVDCPERFSLCCNSTSKAKGHKFVCSKCGKKFEGGECNMVAKNFGKVPDDIQTVSGLCNWIKSFGVDSRNRPNVSAILIGTKSKLRKIFGFKKTKSSGISVRWTTFHDIPIVYK